MDKTVALTPNSLLKYINYPQTNDILKKVPKPLKNLKKTGEKSNKNGDKSDGNISAARRSGLGHTLIKTPNKQQLQL